MKYLLLCALLLCGAFFSNNSAAQAVEPCPNGGTLMNGMCVIPAPSSCSVNTVSYQTGIGYTTVNSVDEAIELLDESHEIAVTRQCNSTGGNWSTPDNIIDDVSGFDATCPTDGSNLKIGNWTRTRTTTRTTCTVTGSWNTGYIATKETGVNPTTTTETREYRINFSPDGGSQCPPSGQAQFNLGPVQLGGTNYCFYQAYLDDEECDCNNFRGDSLTTANTFRAPKGQFSRANPPQCVMQQEFVAGRDKPLTCTCQVSAQKWMSTNSGFENGVEYERWETLPVQNGQPSGTFTGVKCGADDGGPVKPEDDAPNDCFTLKNGVKWCWADPAEKCQIVNGQEQCASGCGRVNGDFVCYNNDPPVTPPRDKTEGNPINDDITDPNKPMNQMVKQDFKDVNSGIEQRLDNVIIAVDNAATSVDSVGDKVEDTNKHLDDIGRQLDGSSKDIGAIKGLLQDIAEKGGSGGGSGSGSGSGNGVGSGGEFESESGLGAGDCTENCSWYETAYPDGIVGIWQEHSDGLKQTPMFEFLNQFSQLSAAGTQPDWNMCFNFGAAGDFGCKSIEIPQIVWAFIKIMILCTAAFLCRALIFGG